MLNAFWSKSDNIFISTSNKTNLYLHKDYIVTKTNSFLFGNVNRSTANFCWCHLVQYGQFYSTHFNFEFNLKRNLKLFKLTLCELNSNIQDTNSRQRLFYSCANTIFILFYSLFVGLGSLSTSYYCSINTNFGVYQIVWNC